MGGYFAVSYRSPLSAAACDSVFWKVRKPRVSVQKMQAGTGAAVQAVVMYGTHFACVRGGSLVFPVKRKKEHLGEVTGEEFFFF